MATENDVLQMIHHALGLQEVWEVQFAKSPVIKGWRVYIKTKDGEVHTQVDNDTIPEALADAIDAHKKWMVEVNKPKPPARTVGYYYIKLGKDAFDWIKAFYDGPGYERPWQVYATNEFFSEKDVIVGARLCPVCLHSIAAHRNAGCTSAGIKGTKCGCTKTPQEIENSVGR